MDGRYVRGRNYRNCGYNCIPRRYNKCTIGVYEGKITGAVIMTVFRGDIMSGW